MLTRSDSISWRHDVLYPRRVTSGCVVVQLIVLEDMWPPCKLSPRFQSLVQLPNVQRLINQQCTAAPRDYATLKLSFCGVLCFNANITCIFLSEFGRTFVLQNLMWRYFGSATWIG
jgi:hypothetical protein